MHVLNLWQVQLSLLLIIVHLYNMPGAELEYRQVALYKKLSEFNDYIANLKYNNKNLQEDELLILRKKFDDIIPHRLEYFECEREALDNFNKIAEILTNNS